MKRIKMIIGALLLLCIVSMVFVSVSNGKSDRNYLLMQNIEALADGEDVSVRVDCTGSGSIYCPLNNKAEYSKVVYSQ